MPRGLLCLPSLGERVPLSGELAFILHLTPENVHGLRCPAPPYGLAEMRVLRDSRKGIGTVEVNEMDSFFRDTHEGWRTWPERLS